MIDPPSSQSPVAALLSAECEARGTISFARFMELALYSPHVGYYEAESPRMGASADFVTAPEISALFGQCLARQLAQWMQVYELDSLVEVGPGSGELAAQVLDELLRLDSLPARYLLVERSAALRAIQSQYLSARVPAKAHAVIDWRTDLGELPQPFDGIVFANELLDALPAHRFSVADSGIEEMRVALSASGEFEYREMAFEDAIAQAECEHLERHIEALPVGYQSELPTGQVSWLRDLARHLRRGACLFVDYGYPRREFYHPQRSRGTVRCYSGQRRHDDPLFAPGSQDISVHVDFTRLAEVASEQGMKVSGFCDQAHFLMANGLLETLKAIPESELGSAAHAAMVQQARMLMMPGEMGEAVKCLLLARGLPDDFELTTARDQRHRL